MPVFEYKALNRGGKKQAGIVDADSERLARLKLKQQALFPVSLVRIADGERTGKKSSAPELFTRAFSRVKSSDLVLMTRLLSTLISAGFPLVNAVETVGGQSRSPRLRRVLSRVKESLEQGESFAGALSRFPHAFSSVYVNMVAAGESSGTLEIVLERLADFSEKREETQKKIWASLAYPIVMSLIGCLVILILMTYIVPGIVAIFIDMNQALPLPTRILIEFSDFFISFWWALLLIPVAASAGMYTLRKTPKGLGATDRIMLHLPVAGRFIRKLSSARFSRTLGALLSHGVPLMTALKITKNVAGNQVISAHIGHAADKVEKGGELGEALDGSRIFPQLTIQMIRIGEKSGALEKMLEKSADIYEKEVQSAVTAATSLIEPLIILAMGIVVGLIIMAVCLPIVEINQMIV